MLPQPNFLNIEYFFKLIYQILFGSFDGSNADLSQFLVLPLWYKVLSVLVSLILIVGIAFFGSKLWEIRRKETEKVYGSSTSVESGIIIKPKTNFRWEAIVEHVNTETPAEWKQAIIEADKMLEELVDSFNLPGDNLGEKLKNISRAEFTTLDDAWEAHKVRNRIAHEIGYNISQYEARRIIGLYEKVFREFDFI